MSTRLHRQALVLFGLAAAAVACAEERVTETTPSVATTTAAAVSNDSAVLQVARARCRRMDECNRLGNGQKYVDRDQCIRAYVDEGAGRSVLRSCPDGVDKRRLDNCLASLADQHCDADLGPLTAMPGCASYCADVR